jgi:hypothetical protein
MSSLNTGNGINLPLTHQQKQQHHQQEQHEREHQQEQGVDQQGNVCGGWDSREYKQHPAKASSLAVPIPSRHLQPSPTPDKHTQQSQQALC